MIWPFSEFSFFPFNLIFGALGIILYILVIAFWVWMIIDCAKRKFRRGWEKIIWLLVVIFGQSLGALIYLIVIFFMNKKGLAK